MSITSTFKCYSGVLALVISAILPANAQDSVSNEALRAEAGSVLAESSIAPKRSATGAKEDDITKFGFPVGEELIYRIYWGIFPVGLTTMKAEWTEENGKKLLAIRYKTHTNRLFDAIYPVDDTAESIVDPSNFLPTRFTFSLTRRKGQNARTVTFDREKLKAIMVTKSTGETNYVDIAADTRDIISLLYNERSLKQKPGQENKYRFMADSGLLDMRLKMYNYEDISLNTFGKVSCLSMEPFAKLDTLLIEDGKVMSWVAKERCLATKMEIKAPLASVRIELDEVRGPGDDSWSRAMQKKHGANSDKTN